MPFAEAAPQGQNLMTPGRPVEVWVQLDKTWAEGFEVEDITPDGYLIRRISDDCLLGATVPVGSVREVRSGAFPPRVRGR